MPEEIIGVRDRIKLYAEECQKKKDIEIRKKLEVGALYDSITDVTRFDSPTRKPKNLNVPANIGKAYQFSPEDEEKKAKIDLVKLLYQDSKHGKETPQIKSFSALRNGYISSMDNLRPEAKPFLIQTKVERKREAEKLKTYDSLKNAWETYEDTAQDKPDPDNLTPEEEAAEEKVIEVETAVNGAWQEYAEEVVEAVQNDDGSDDDDSDDEDDWDFWILEAKRLKAEAERKKAEAERKKAEKEAKKKAKAKAKRRKEKEEERKRLEAEDGDIVEIAKRLKEEARKKKNEKKNSKAKGGTAESNDTKNVGKFESDKSKSKGSLDSDSDSDVVAVTNAKNVGKTGKSKSKEDLEEIDSDDATGGKAKNSGKGKKGRFESDSDDSDSNDATSTKAIEDSKRKSVEKDKARKKKEDKEKAEAANSKAKRGNANSNGTKNVGKYESDKSKSKGSLDSDSDSDVVTVTKAKNGGKTGKSKSKGDVEESDVQSESRVDEERKRSREERRQKRKAAKTKNKSGDVVKEVVVKEVVVGSNEDARRRQLAFSWYSKHSTPNRSEFKEKVALLFMFSIDPDAITQADVDLLPWNSTGSVVNIAKMNALTRASLSIMKSKQ
jgi:hypothetical protein